MKKFLVLLVFMMTVGVVMTFLAFRTAPLVPDAVFLNDALQQALELETQREMVEALTMDLEQAFLDMDNLRASRDVVLQLFMYVFIGCLGLIGMLFYLYGELKIMAPFKKLQTFASKVASGNFDVPLEMSRDNFFGAFTESFDLMREELRVAKENEILANKSKKELVASLSHDIKTPVASIMSAMELMLLKVEDARDVKRIQNVMGKCEQINTLITDMFHATLEELQALKVSPVEIPSTVVADLIGQADFESRVVGFTVPNCLIVADVTRLQQVFDNIITNAYKYANTDLTVEATLDSDFLVVGIRDFGPGVSEEELSLLFNKFYRSGAVSDVVGYGLGLYLTQYFMAEMSGEVVCENLDDGFVVWVKLKLAG